MHTHTLTQGRPGEQGAKGQPGPSGEAVRNELSILSPFKQLYLGRCHLSTVSSLPQGGAGDPGDAGRPGLDGSRVSHNILVTVCSADGHMCIV